jgi:hypothetical protein
VRVLGSSAGSRGNQRSTTELIITRQDSHNLIDLLLNFLGCIHNSLQVRQVLSKIGRRLMLSESCQSRLLLQSRNQSLIENRIRLRHLISNISRVQVLGFVSQCHDFVEEFIDQQEIILPSNIIPSSLREFVEPLLESIRSDFGTNEHLVCNLSHSIEVSLVDLFGHPSVEDILCHGSMGVNPSSLSIPQSTEEAASWSIPLESRGEL